MTTLRFPRLPRALPATLAAALALSLLPADGHARVITAEMRAYCTSDALRLCFSEIPDVERITACMRAKRASLTEQCRREVNKHDGK